MLQTLGVSVGSTADIWDSWLRIVNIFKHSSILSEPVFMEFEKKRTAAKATAVSTFPFSTPTCYHGHRFVLFRYMRSMLRMNQHDPDVHTWVQDVRCRTSQGRSVVGLRMHRVAAQWFEEFLMPEVCQWHARRFGMDGSLLSLMTEPIGNGSAQLFSAVVYGISYARVSMYGLGRMEWLALELVTEARQVLLARMSNASDALWRVIEQKLQRCRSDMELSIAFAPHKPRKLGNGFEASAAGTGERADVLLLAWPSDAEDASVLGWAYHTTNIPSGTATMRPGQAYPESRILWRQCTPLPDLMKLAAYSLAKRLNLPCSGSADDLLDEAVWCSGVLSQGSDPADVPEVSEASGNDSDFDSDPEL